jgi:hypothetical protein
MSDVVANRLGGAARSRQCSALSRRASRVASGLVAGVGSILLLLLGPMASADPYSSGRVAQVPQGVGCYWYRGNLYCSRYCYWEIDGYRYCRRRADEAFSQAPPPIYAPYPPRREPRSGRAPVK